MDTSQLAYPKPEPRKRTKARKDRHEAAVKKSVRLQVLERDYSCRLRGWVMGDRFPGYLGMTCEGLVEWCHLHSHRRSQTRGKAAEQRHTSAASVALCALHHRQYDAHHLRITALTRRGAGGPLKFTKGPA